MPDLPFIPAPLAGRQTIAIRYASITGPAVAEALLAPIRATATPVLDGIGELAYRDIARIHDDPASPAPVQEAHMLMNGLTPAAVGALLGAAGPGSGSPLLSVELRRLGGALARAPRHASAFSYRDAEYALHTLGLAVPPDQETVAAHAAQVIEAVQPWSTGARFANFAASSDPAQTARAYDQDTLDTLAATADRYDSAGTFTPSPGAR